MFGLGAVVSFSPHVSHRFGHSARMRVRSALGPLVHPLIFSKTQPRASMQSLVVVVVVEEAQYVPHITGQAKRIALRIISSATVHAAVVSYLQVSASKQPEVVVVALVVLAVVVVGSGVEGCETHSKLTQLSPAGQRLPRAPPQMGSTGLVVESVASCGVGVVVGFGCGVGFVGDVGFSVVAEDPLAVIPVVTATAVVLCGVGPCVGPCVGPGQRLGQYVW